MPTVTELLFRSLYRNLFSRTEWGDIPGVPQRIPEMEVLMRTERSPEFERLCMNRKICGAVRYGMLGVTGKPKWDLVNDAIRRLELYRDDHNAEHLVDVANLCELEFVEGDCRVEAHAEGEHVKEAT